MPSLSHSTAQSTAANGGESEATVYVGTFAPIVAHIQHPEMTDRTLCGCRIRWWLRPHQVEAMGVCVSCERIAAERRAA